MKLGASQTLQGHNMTRVAAARAAVSRAGPVQGPGAKLER